MDLKSPEDELASTLQKFSEKAHCYWWRLTGDHPNSLCDFLGIDEEDAKASLKGVGVHKSTNPMSVSSNKFEEFFQLRCGFEWAQYKCKDWPKPEPFIQFGTGDQECKKPKALHDATDGSLNHCPTKEQHFQTRTRSQRAAAFQLIDSVAEATAKPKKPAPKKDLSPGEELFAFVRTLTSSGTINRRDANRMKKMANEIVDFDFKKLAESLRNGLEHMGDVKEEAMTPDRTASDAAVVTPAAPSNLMEDIELEDTADDDLDPAVQQKVVVDEFVQELKEETLLQSLLQKRINERKERAFELRQRNGRRSLVVCPPDAQTSAKFQEEAKRTGWLEKVVDAPARKEGLLSCMATIHREDGKQVAIAKKVSTEKTMSTAETMGMARVGNLNDSRLAGVRSHVKKIGNLDLKHSAGEVEKIDKEVGTHRTKEATFATHVHEWAGTKGREKKPPETVEHWNGDSLHEIEAEVDLHSSEVMEEQAQENPKQASVPSLECQASGFDKPGMAICIGGDHGDQNCPINAELNLTPPELRKKKNDLNCKCPMIQFASVKCSKDACDPMEATVMPKVRADALKPQKSSIITVCNKNDTKKCQSHTVPKTIKLNAIAFRRNQEATQMTCALEGTTEADTNFGLIDLGVDMSAQPHFDLEHEVTVTNFNELPIGDLAFLCMVMGVNNSDGDHCIHCMFKGSEFNKGLTQTERAIENMAECLEAHLAMEKKPANLFGVNSKGLLHNIDPQRIVVPILHCPVGLADEVLDAFKRWHNLEVERVDEETDAARRAYKIAEATKKAAESTQKALESAIKEDPSNKDTKRQLKEAKKAATKARSLRKKANDVCMDLMQKHNARKASLAQRIEGVFKKNGITREHCHGGKFNGVNCIRIMESSKELFIGDENEQGGFLQSILESKMDSATDDMVRNKCRDFERMFGPLDAVWSKARGIEHGLPPTEEQSNELDKALEMGKVHWLYMGIDTLQPKWHLTFEGHLSEQCRKFGGLADKADDTIEKFHQESKTLRTRHRGTTSCKKRELCIRRELRRKRSPKVKRHVDKCQKLIKRSPTSKRAAEARERSEDKKRANQERRDGYVNNTTAS